MKACQIPVGLLLNSPCFRLEITEAVEAALVVFADLFVGRAAIALVALPMVCDSSSVWASFHVGTVLRRAFWEKDGDQEGCEEELHCSIGGCGSVEI